jgi:hypothetical protein
MKKFEAKKAKEFLSSSFIEWRKLQKEKAREWSKDEYKYWKGLHNKRQAERLVIDLDPELEKFLYKYENEAISRKRTKERARKFKNARIITHE